jgi:uncharacterized protein
MKSIFSALIIALSLAGCASTGPASAGNAVTANKQKVIFQVSDADPKKWALALNNAENVQEDLGKKNVEIEIVAYGPGIGMLKMDSEVSGRVTQALNNGVTIAACENTMTKQKISRTEMIEKVSFVKAGVVELMQKQQQGFAYIRP